MPRPIGETVSRPIPRRAFLKGASFAGAGTFLASAGTARASAVVFDARDFGVIADGTPHNNVANLLDCVAQAAAAGANVTLPAGVIDTSEAVVNATLTADSGRTYTNNGGIPLPVATPMTISGQGRGSTIIRLSAGFPRAFDFWWVADGQSYSGLTMRQLTIDRNHLTGEAIAPPTAVTAPAILIRGGWTTLTGVPAETFKNARFVWFPGTNIGSAQNLGMAARVAEGAVQVRNDSDTTDYVILGGDLVHGSLRDHVIVGTTQFGGSVPSGWDMTIDRVTIESIESVNVSTQTADGLTAKKSDSSPNIMIDLKKTSGSLVPAVTNCVVRDVQMHGGESGAYIGGQNGCFIDDCWFIDSFHDTLVDPITNYVSANFMFGQNAWVGRVGLLRCHGRRSGDVACEIDQPWEASETDCTWEDAFNGVYSTSFVPPARTRAGPPTTRLGSDLGALGSESDPVVVPIGGLPAGTSRAGILQIDSELFWYSAPDEAGTAVTLRRGLNGTTIAGHTAGAIVTFVETHKTRFSSVGSTIRNGVIMAVPGAGRGFLQYQHDNLPLPPVSIRDAAIDISGGTSTPGQAIYWIGWQSDLDVAGLRFAQTGLSASGADAGSAISWRWDHGETPETPAPFPSPQVRGRSNSARVQGVVDSPSAVYQTLKPGDRVTIVDFDITADIDLGPTVAGPGIPAGR